MNAFAELGSKGAGKTAKMIFSNEDPITLNSYDDYRKWYLGYHDFSMFNVEEVYVLLDEEQPNNYPCTPIIINCYSEIFYLSISNITIKAHCTV